VVSADISSLDYLERVARSKFGTDPQFAGFGTHATGVIGFQDHGDTSLSLRSVRIREL
jgi:hypothetical protein